MTAEKWVTLWCDEPGCEAHYQGDTRTASTRREARGAGWSYRKATHAGAHNGRDYCPEHRRQSGRTAATD